MLTESGETCGYGDNYEARMKRKIIQKVKMEVAFCDICKGQINAEPWSGSGAAKRIGIVKGLLKLGDFDAHEKCINNVIREAIRPFLEKEKPRGGAGIKG